VQDGDSAFYPAELAEHRVIGFEHAFTNGVNLRVEAYQKHLVDLRPQYHNLIDVVNIFPEVEADRITVQPDHGEAKGLEIFLKRDTGGKFSWWGSYGFAFAEDQVDGQTVPRDFDQRHTVYLDFNYRPNPQWRLNTAWQYHSGWPYTNAAYIEIKLPDNTSFYQLVYGPRNAERFPAYHRLDVRANRYFNLGKGRLAVFLEVVNLYNRANVRAYEYYLSRSPNRQITVVKEAQKWLPRLPSIGVSWEF
jgi:hypothetical protein